MRKQAAAMDSDDVFRIFYLMARDRANVSVQASGLPLPDIERLLSELVPLLQRAAMKTSADRARHAEAMENVDRFLKDVEQEVRTQGRVQGAVGNVLTALCPFFPIC
jgi:hypothetical protein